MIKTKMTGKRTVGELRLAPLDIGFDLRLQGMPLQLPEHFGSVGIEVGGETYLLKGAREEMVTAIRAAGYRVCE